MTSIIIILTVIHIQKYDRVPPVPNSPRLPIAGRRKSTTLSRTGGRCLDWSLLPSPNSSSPHSSQCSHPGCLLSLKHPALLSATGPLHMLFLLPEMCFLHSTPLPSLPRLTPKRLCLTSNITSSKKPSWTSPPLVHMGTLGLHSSIPTPHPCIVLHSTEM